MISAPALSELLHTAFTHDDPADDPAHLWRDVLHELARLFDADAALALRVENRDRVQVAATYRWPTPLTTDLIPVAPDSQADFVLSNNGVHDIDVRDELCRAECCSKPASNSPVQRESRPTTARRD